jgi:hypothetical protein
VAAAARPRGHARRTAVRAVAHARRCRDRRSGRRQRRRGGRGQPGEPPARPAAVTEHLGAHGRLGAAYQRIQEWLAANGEAGGPPERSTTGSSSTANRTRRTGRRWSPATAPAAHPRTASQILRHPAGAARLAAHGVDRARVRRRRIVAVLLGVLAIAASPASTAWPEPRCLPPQPAARPRTRARRRPQHRSRPGGLVRVVPAGGAVCARAGSHRQALRGARRERRDGASLVGQEARDEVFSAGQMPATTPV